MSLVKLNKRRFPWMSNDVEAWFDTNNLFVDDLFTSKGNVPAMNIKENPENFEIELAVPGFDKNDLEVSLENDILHVCAEKRKEQVEEEEEGYTRKEFSYNSFDRKLQMPSSVNQNEEIKASYENGVLKLQLAKQDVALEPPKKKIEIA